MEEKDKWINNLRHRMEDYSEPAPADLWEQLEKELNVTPKVIPMWRRWQAIAAIALVVVVSSVTVWFWHSSSADYIEQKSVEIASIPQLEEMEEPIPSRPSLTEITPEAAPSPVKTTMKAVASVLLGNAPAAEKVEEVEAVKEEQTEATGNREEKNVEKQEEAVAEPQKRPAVKTTKRKDYYAYVAPRKTKETNWSVGLSAGNIPFSSTMGYSGYGNLPGGQTRKASGQNALTGVNSPAELLEVRSDTYNKILFNNISEETETDIEHRMPITFGASLRFELDDKWGIETGVTYTLLSTDLRSGSEEYYYKDEQRLHYVGIPLKVHRRLWDNKRFEIYASAGGAVEKCVSGTLASVETAGESDRKIKNEKIKVKPLQWSLSAAAGAQFKITDKLGIYAEPGVVYYFDDGSDRATIRKEHPFNFNIQLGVRFSLPK